MDISNFFLVDLSPPMRLSDHKDDILTKWRLKNQMEIARHLARQQESAAPAAATPARHHFVRSTARAPPPPPPPPPPSQPETLLPQGRKELRETGTQMSTPVSSRQVLSQELGPLTCWPAANDLSESGPANMLISNLVLCNFFYVHSEVHKIVQKYSVNMTLTAVFTDIT